MKYLSLFAGIILLTVASKSSFPSDAARIAILLSDDGAAYTEPAKAFEAEVEIPVKVYNLEGDVRNAAGIMKKIYDDRPSLIYTLGAKAAYVAKIESVKNKKNAVPIIFAMVLNWERYDLLKGVDYIAGVSSDTDPGTQFAYLSLFAPQVKRVGVIYSEEHSARKIEKALADSRRLNLELVAAPITHPKEFRNAFNQIKPKIDAFWILTDPVIFSPKNMEWLKDTCIDNNIITMGQSKNIADLGIMIAVNTDIQEIGIQSASIAKNIIIRNQNPKTIGVMPPLSTELILNLKTAKKIGISIHTDVKTIANEIIGD